MKFWLVFLLCLNIGPLTAQTPCYLHFTIEDGLPSNLIYSAVQDKEGYLWFGTDKGLARFDGENFKTYGTEDGLPDTEVIHLYEDLNERLWIVCFRQKPAYRFEGQFFSERNDTLLCKFRSSRIHFEFFETSDSMLWISGDETYKIKGNSYTTLKLKVAKVTSSKKSLFGMHGMSIYLLKVTGEVDQLLYAFPHKTPGVFANSGDRFFYSFLDKSYLLEYADSRVREIGTLPESYQKVTTDRQGRFWGCLPGKGAVCFDNQIGDLSNPVLYLPGKKVNNVFEDKQGNFWFLTQGEGLYLLPRQYGVLWQNTHDLPSNNLLSLAHSPDGSILVGDDVGNVHRFVLGKRLETTAFGARDGSNFVRQILPEEDGQFWVATDEGFYRRQNRDIRTFNTLIYDNDIVNIGAAKAILRTGERYWFGSNWQFATFNSTEGAPKSVIGNLRVTCLTRDDEGFIWKGGTEGIYSQNDSFHSNLGERFPLLKNRIAAMRSGGKGRLWVVTPENGLLDVQVSQGKVSSVTAVRFRLPSLVKDIKNLRMASDGALWLATNRGVFRLGKSWDLSRFTNRHGLASNEVHDVLPLGDTLWAATANGLSMLRLPGEKTFPDFQTALSGFQYQLGKSTISLDFSGKASSPIRIVLDNNARLPKVFFVGLNRPVAEGLEFRHIRTQGGLPFPWLTFSTLLQCFTDTLMVKDASLPLGADLPAGRYRFHSTALTFNGSSGRPVEWELHVLPHWTQTIWPWLALLAVTSLLLWRFYGFRTRFLQMENSISQLKLQALRAQINPHFIGNSINAIQKFFYPPDPEKGSEYIHLFTVLLRKTLLLSEKDFIPFSEELQYDRDYLEMIKLRYAGQFKYEVTGLESIPPSLPFPAMFLQPILENATSHGLAQKQNSLLKLHFFIENQRFICTVTDNGAGILAANKHPKDKHLKHVSKGIELLENKARMLNRLYDVGIKLEWFDLSQSAAEKGPGTQVKVSFLLKKDILENKNQHNTA